MQSNGTIGICIAGEGAMGATHARVLTDIPGVRLTALVSGDRAAGNDFAAQWNIPFHSRSLAECLARPDVDAVVIATPSGLHAEHGLCAVRARKPALIEIPVALTLEDAARLAAAAHESGVPIMAAHSRRFAPPHRDIRDKIRAGHFRLHHLVVETYFFRRTNLNMFGQPRSWADNLLWHHACHSVDLAMWLLGDTAPEAWAQRGPDHPDLGIAMDLTIGMRFPAAGALVSMALSFNNKGPFGGFYRYIGEEETYRVFRDEMRDSSDRIVPLQGASFANQDAAFVETIRTGKAREAAIADVLPAMRILDLLNKQVGGV